MIEINDKTYIKTIWFVDIKGSGDWMACMIKHEGKDFEGLYRFKYFMSNEKSWYKTSGAREKLNVIELEELFDDMANETARLFCTKAQKIEINEYGEKAVDIMLKQPWFNCFKKSNRTEWEDEVNNIIH